MSSTQTQTKEKVRVTIDDSFELPKQEYKDLILDSGDKYEDPDTKEMVESIWQKQDGSNFLNTEFNGFRRICPTFYNKYIEECNREENKGKIVQLVYKGHLFGQNQRGNFVTFWKLKQSNGQGGPGGNSKPGGFPPAALDAVHFGEVDEINDFLKNHPNEKWYVVGEPHIIQNKEGLPMCYVLIKRNRSFQN